MSKTADRKDLGSEPFARADKNKHSGAAFHALAQGDSSGSTSSVFGAVGRWFSGDSSSGSFPRGGRGKGRGRGRGSSSMNAPNPDDIKPVTVTAADSRGIRVVCISDTHNRHRDLDAAGVPDGDILIHAGDFTLYGKKEHAADFNAWLGTLPHAHKIVINGNHEHNAEWNTEGGGAARILSNATFLRQSVAEVAVAGKGTVRIFGCEFFWPAAPNGGVNAHYGQVPDDVDIVVTHGPVKGYVDGGSGCGAMLQVVQRLVRARAGVRVAAAMAAAADQYKSKVQEDGGQQQRHQEERSTRGVEQEDQGQSQEDEQQARKESEKVKDAGSEQAERAQSESPSTVNLDASVCAASTGIDENTANARDASGASCGSGTQGLSLVVSGHIHHAHGIVGGGWLSGTSGVTFVNAANCGGGRTIQFGAVVVDI